MNDELRKANERGFALGKRHAAIAEVIGQAALWASSFGVLTPHVLPDGAALVTYPLRGQAADLNELWCRLGGACVDLAFSLDGGTDADRASSPSLRSEAAGGSTTYAAGADYVHYLQSRNPNHITLQDSWRTEVTNASLYLSVAGICTGELERYARFSQSLFDTAAALTREAYALAVAATYGRIWAVTSQGQEGRVLIAWMKALADVNFSFEECVSELRGFEVVSPEAMSYCLMNRSAWLREE